MTATQVDVLIIGAGISGIGAAYHLQKKAPSRSYTILEGRDVVGGTWDLFRYPGIRSDSDMYTLGYSFKPWRDDKAIADAGTILAYLNETADENDIRKHIRFRHRVVAAHWSSRAARWLVEVEADGERKDFECKFLFMCGGYYKYSEGYLPVFPNTDQFKGEIVHPQNWTEDIDYKGKRVIVIGSGATAVTLVPELAKDAEHVVMLQRSPTYMISRPQEDAIANWLKKRLPPKLAYWMTRWKNISLGRYFFSKAQKNPTGVAAYLINLVREQLPEDYDVEKHFTPKYNPWDQRLCLVQDGDMFKAISDGHASVVTDHIETFTESGIRLVSGEELEADLIVTATGLVLEVLNGVDVSIDGAKLDVSKCLNYKGIMYSGVPNLALTMGYTNSSWTLKADLTSAYICRLLNFMERTGKQICVPRVTDPTVEPEPLTKFSPGYFKRAEHILPKQGSKRPWRLHQNVFRDKISLGLGRVNDGVMEFSNPEPASVTEPIGEAAE